ncbi:MAG TPA: flagellar biosynthetic protein FliO [Methylococcaceae bacterium]|nr:flagellar biosynthetic protein FliO [Methylococcaceae bacterium]
MRRTGLVASCLVLAPAMAAEGERSGFKAPPAIDIVQWIGGLVVVLTAILVFGWALRRLGNFSRLEAGRFQVLAAISVGARERVVLVQAGDKQLLLGVAPGRVQTLCILEGEEAIKTGLAAPGKGDAFAQRLAALLPGKRS